MAIEMGFAKSNKGVLSKEEVASDDLKFLEETCGPFLVNDRVDDT